MKLPLTLHEGLGPICIKDAAGHSVCDSIPDIATGEAIVAAVNLQHELVTALRKAANALGVGRTPLCSPELAVEIQSVLMKVGQS